MDGKQTVFLDRPGQQLALMQQQTLTDGNANSGSSVSNSAISEAAGAQRNGLPSRLPDWLIVVTRGQLLEKPGFGGARTRGLSRVKRA